MLSRDPFVRGRAPTLTLDDTDYVQKTESFTGIDGINTQDRAIQEGMGAIVVAVASTSARRIARSSRRAACCWRRCGSSPRAPAPFE
jgi:hypothetical protein